MANLISEAGDRPCEKLEGIDHIAVSVVPEPHFQMEMRSKRKAGISYRAEPLAGANPISTGDRDIVHVGIDQIEGLMGRHGSYPTTQVGGCDGARVAHAHGDVAAKPRVVELDADNRPANHGRDRTAGRAGPWRHINASMRSIRSVRRSSSAEAECDTGHLNREHGALRRHHRPTLGHDYPQTQNRHRPGPRRHLQPAHRSLLSDQTERRDRP